MKSERKTAVVLISVCVALWTGTSAAQTKSGQDSQGISPSTQGGALNRSEVEKQRNEVRQEAEKSLDRDAIAAMNETVKAVTAIDSNNADEALRHIEAATGKINVLVARNPATAVLPIGFEVTAIDSAPLSIPAIKERAKAADEAVESKDFPLARELLDGLVSEIRVRTYNLPLATYPAALKEAARRLDEKQTDDAKGVLRTALHTILTIDRVSPLPLLIGIAAIDEAQELASRSKEARASLGQTTENGAQANTPNNKDRALKLLALARNEIDRAKELGYSPRDPEYDQMTNEIKEIERQVKDNGESRSLFSGIKERMSSFFKRNQENVRR